MNRTVLLLAAVVALLVANLGYHWWKGRGLITVHCEDWPVTKVIREIEKQGRVTLKTNLPADTKVRMHVDKVPLTEALETLSVITEARWRMAFFIADSNPAIQAEIGAFSAGNRSDTWRRISVPVPNILEEEGPPPDPRGDRWEVKATNPATLQAYLEQAAQQVSATFYVPESWNPTISSTPKGGLIGDAIPALAKAAGGKSVEVFLLDRGRPRGEQGPPRERREGENPRFTFNREAMEERALAEIEKLPPEKREVAKKEFEERRQFFSGLRELPPEERRAKMEEFFNRDANQERMERRNSEREARMTPAQRVQRAQRYSQRKQQVREGGR